MGNKVIELAKHRGRRRKPVARSSETAPQRAAHEAFEALSETLAKASENIRAAMAPFAAFAEYIEQCHVNAEHLLKVFDNGECDFPTIKAYVESNPPDGGTIAFLIFAVRERAHSDRARVAAKARADLYARQKKQALAEWRALKSPMSLAAFARKLSPRINVVPSTIERWVRRAGR